jgi:D-alanine-D-alanine ligase
VTRPRVLLLCGGRSDEHEVSLASARSVLAAAGGRFMVTPLVIARDGRLLPPGTSAQALASGNSAGLAAEPGGGLERLEPATFDVVLPLLHGPFGEDGSVQGLLKIMGLPFVGSDVLGSAVGMDKGMMKAVFAAHGLPQLPHRVVTRTSWQTQPREVLKQLAALPYPLFVKPANLGSSVGISRAENNAELRQALDEAARFDRRIIVEQGLTGARELEVGVLGNDQPETSVVGEINFKGAFYDYSSKYTEGEAALLIPAPVPDEVAAYAQELALAAFRAVDAAGLARVDFFVHEGTLYLNEINTMPGFTTTSMYPKLWEASGVPYEALIARLVELALEPR